jgi:hypothetical protein
MRLIYSVILLGLIAGWNNARAGTCTTITPQISTLSVGTITVPRDAPVGTVIFSGAGHIRALTFPAVLTHSCWVSACDIIMRR